MKKNHLSILALGLLALAGCTQLKEEMELPQGDEVTLEVYAESEDATRMGFDNQGKFYWSETDVLGVTSTNSKEMLSGLKIKSGAGTNHATFTGTVSGRVEGYAVCPHSDDHYFEGSTLNYILPESYTYETIDEDFFSATQGEGNSFNAPMWGKIENGSVRMLHLGGVLCIKMGKLPVGENLKMVISSRQRMNGYFTANLNDPTPMLQTEVTSNPTEKTVTFYFKNTKADKSGVFYAPLPAGTYKLMRIKVYNGENEVGNIGIGTVELARTKLKMIPLNNAEIGGGDTGGDITAKEASADLLFGSQNDEQNLNLNMKSNWHVEVEGQPVTRAAAVGNDWIQISPMSGQAGNVTISTKTNANTTNQDRKSRIRIVSDDDDDIDLDVLQVSDEAMVVAKPKYTYGPTGGSLELDVDDLEDNFTIETSVGWIKNNSLLDDDDRRLFEITENTSASPRYGKVIFTSGDQKTKQIIEFEQFGNDGQVNPGTHPGGGILIISSQNQTFDCNRHEFDIEVLSKTPFQVETPSLPWMHHVETIGQRIHFSVDANATYEGRNALIRIYNTQNNQMTMLSVNQMQKDAIILANPMYQYTQFGGTLKFEVGHNVEYDMAIDVDWIKPAPQTKAFTQDALEFTIAENKTNDNREGHITFTSKDKAITQTVLVKQAQVDAMIIKQTDFKLDDKEQTITVNVESNVPFEIVNNIPWVHQQITPATKGMTPNTLTFLVDKNSGYSERTGELLVRSTDMKQRVKITISQTQHNAIVLPRALYTIGYLSQSLTAEVEANVDYNVTTDADWIHYSPAPTTRALVKSGVTVNIEQNPNETLSREGHIILTAKDGTKAEITIRQLPEKMQHEVNVRKRLTALYNANNGDGWWDSTNWCTDEPLNTWYGVKFENNLLTLDLSHNNIIGDVNLSYFPELFSLNLSNNETNSVNVSNCISVENIECTNSLMTHIDVTNCPTLHKLNCGNNHLTELLLTDNKELINLECPNNGIKSINFSNNLKLNNLNLYKNSFHSLKVNHLKQLQILNIEDNYIEKLDLSEMPELKTVECTNNRLYNIKLNGCNTLNKIRAARNYLPSINISDCKELKSLDARSNDLWPKEEEERLKFIVVWDGFKETEHTGFTKLNTTRYTKINSFEGAPISFTNSTLKEDILRVYDYNMDDEISSKEVVYVVNLFLLYTTGNINELYKLPYLETLYISDGGRKITNIDLTNLHRLKTLTLSSLEGLNLDFKDNPNLENIEMTYYTKVPTLDFSKNKQLKSFKATRCDLRNIDFSQNQNISTIYFRETLLHTLNLTNCINLNSIDLELNHVYELDISSCTKLKNIDLRYENIDNLYVWKGFQKGSHYINTSTKIIEK